MVESKATFGARAAFGRRCVWLGLLSVGGVAAPACSGSRIDAPSASGGTGGKVTGVDNGGTRQTGQGNASGKAGTEHDAGAGGEVVTSGGGTSGGVATGGVTAGGVSGAGTTGGVPMGGVSGGGVNGGTGGFGGSAGGFAGNNPNTCPPNSVRHADDMLCHCQPATLTQCADGCGDLTLDPDHCGNCDTKCGPTVTCTASQCGVAPTTLVPAVTGCGALQLALGGGKLYWTDRLHGSLSSVAITGGAPQPLLQNQAAPTQIIVSGSSLYWLASGKKSIMTATTAGASPTIVMQSADDIGGFTLSIDGQTLYFSAGTKVNKTTSAPGGAVTEVGHEDAGIPRGLALTGNLIAFPTDLNADVDVMTLVDGTPAVCATPDSTTAVNLNCARAARSQGLLLLDSIFIVNGRVHWANGLSLLSAPVVNPQDFSETSATAQSPMASTITAFTIEAQNSYLADDAGFVYQATVIPNGPTLAIARGQGAPTSIVADATHVYWATQDCAIRSTPVLSL
jgi:hypothetical protein